MRTNADRTALNAALRDVGLGVGNVEIERAGDDFQIRVCALDDQDARRTRRLLDGVVQAHGNLSVKRGFRRPAAAA